MTNRANFAEIRFKGATGKLTDNIINNWLIGLRETNPAILDILRDRDLKPYRDLLQWSGEFSGKYITGAYYIYRITKNKKLFNYIIKFIDELLTYQDEDGYLGCYSKECHITGAFSKTPDVIGETWDSWTHYHLMYGLLKWYEETNNPKYFDAIKKIADFYLNNFYNEKKTIVSIGWSEMNLAVYHSFAMLYNFTKEKKYLKFALNIEEDLKEETAGDYLTVGLKQIEYFKCNKPRWESMHIIMGLAEMYKATNDKKYLEAVSFLTNSILKTDVHNTGGFSTAEQAIGNPFTYGAIETCCVIAYNALVYEVYRLTQDIKLIDHLEISHYNAVLGYYSPTGKWSTYDTPMDGTKKANFQDIVFQCRPGSPELNCCSVNAPRGVSLIGEWAIVEDDKNIVINTYESMYVENDDASSIEIEGNYPHNNKVKIIINGLNKPIKIRIPFWSQETKVLCDGKEIKAKAGEYLNIGNPNIVDITFDYTPYIIKGDFDVKGKTSLYYGCILFAWDNSYNPNFDFDNLPTINYKDLLKYKPKLQKDGSYILYVNNGIKLIDFYHAGLRGSNYKTWINIKTLE
jgi:hypothetical protein